MSEKLRFLLPNPCQNHLDGCKEFLMESDLPDHEAECVFRKANCVCMSCQEKVPYHDFTNHVRDEQHGLITLKNEPVRKIRFKAITGTLYPTLLEQKGKNFFLTVSKATLQPGFTYLGQ